MAKIISQSCCRLLRHRINLYYLLPKLTRELAQDYIFRIINLLVLMASAVFLVFVEIGRQIKVGKSLEEQN